MEFYRKRLGIPYELSGGSITREDFLINSFTEPYHEEFMKEDKGSSYYMGVDQGNELQVLIGKISDDNPDIIKTVHSELVDPIAPSGEDSLDYGFSRIGKLMNLYKIRRCVIDADPNRHDALSLRKDFPGRVILADYAEHKEDIKIKRDRKTKTITNVTINRTTGFDNLLDIIKKGRFLLYGDASKIPQDVELIIDQITAIKRDVEIRKTRAGEIEVAVYRKVREDHFAHAASYLISAAELDKSGKGRVAILGATDQDETENLDEKEWNDIVKGVINYLAEVPTGQLQEYVLNYDDPDYEMPFPLYFKIKVTLNEYTLDDVLQIIKDNLI